MGLLLLVLVYNYAPDDFRDRTPALGWHGLRVDEAGSAAKCVWRNLAAVVLHHECGRVPRVLDAQLLKLAGAAGHPLQRALHVALPSLHVHAAA